MSKKPPPHQNLQHHHQQDESFLLEEDAKYYENIKQENLPKIGSLSRECTKLKEKYDVCFMEWYIQDFLQGKTKGNMTPCEDLFKDYQKCVKRALKRLEIPIDPVGSCPV